MFEHEENYTGYFLVYYNEFYYVYDDDENNLYIYKFIISRDDCDGIKKDGMYYVFDFENPQVISKIDSNYKVRRYDLGISHDKIMSYKKQKEDSIRRFGDVLTVKKYNHELIYLWQDEKFIYYVGLRGGHILNKVEKISIDKIGKLSSRLTEEEKNELLINLDDALLMSDNLFIDSNINEINKIKEKHLKGGE